MKAPKFNFVPERQLGGNDQQITAFTASIYTNGQIVFKSDYIRIYELDNKYVRVFCDLEKRAIGWSVIEGKTELDELGDARLLKQDINGAAKLSVKKILSRLGYKELKTSILDLEIKTYKSMMHAGEIFYVIIPEPEVNVTLNGHKQE